jgi:hypothetical protein
MDRIAKVLAEQEGSLSTPGKLALLTSVGTDKDDPLAAGRIIRRTGEVVSAQIPEVPAALQQR